MYVSYYENIYLFIYEETIVYVHRFNFKNLNILFNRFYFKKKYF